MRWGVSCGLRSRTIAAIISGIPLVTIAASPPAFAQTTQILSVPDTQIADTMIRNGPYATWNHDNAVLLTRRSAVPDWERRTIFGVNTSSIPVGSIVTSAVLSLTVRSGLGNPGATTPVTAYRLTSSFVERQASWLNRQTATPWQTPGGDLGESCVTVPVPNGVGTRVHFDVTALVQRAVNGGDGSRQALIALVDVSTGGDGKETYREYHASEASSSSNRPQLTVSYGPPGLGTIDVPAGGDLQQALNLVQPGGMLRLASGATYIGNFVLPAKNGADFITLTTANAALPPAGTRIDPSYRAGLATIRSSNEFPALATAPGASYYRIVGIAFESNVGGGGDVIALGDHAQASLSQVPHHLELDRVLITGDAAVGQKRGVAANAAHVSIANSDIRGIKAIAQDSQAIAAWNTPGPITITNNYLEAAGENIMFGGAHINIPNAVPSDIRIENNILTKDVAWRGTSWTVKNIFELKNARRVLVRNNILEYNWLAAQNGFAIVLTVRNSSGQNPWVVIEDVEFSNNILRYSGSAFNILGHDDTARSGQLARLLIRDNVVHDISGSQWGGSGIFAQIGGEPRDITIDHNTVMHTGNIITFYSGSYINASGTRVTGGPVVGLVFTNNLMKHNAYGIIGNSQGYGNATINYYTSGAVVRRNVFATDKSIASRYPADNLFPTVATFMSNFVNPVLKDYRLVPGSPYIGAGLDGTDLGAR
jgi:hypothetical protein